MYLRNSWYVAAWSRDLTDRPVALRILDEPVVVFRTESGEVAALEDRCPHRHLPLSMGNRVGEAIQCGYHGMTFNRHGQCVGVPSQALVPPTARVRFYPATERYGWVWVWMGDIDRADPALIPDFHQLTDPAFAAVGKTNHVDAAYTLVTDNLLDLSHVGYVHTSTIGNAAFTEKGKLTHRRTERGVVVTRLVPDVPPPPTYIKTGVLPEGRNIDRWQHIEFIAPCFVLIHVGGAEVGTGGLEGRCEHGLNIWVLNAMTPETATTSNYFWASVRAHALGDATADALFFDQVSQAFEEDRRVLEAQQAVLRTREDSWSVALKADAGSIEARRVLDKLIAAERASASDQGETKPTPSCQRRLASPTR
jgi:phenylpropionate dioxygenase-like ring-hydroxylating dioxygenase large terminal subunit